MNRFKPSWAFTIRTLTGILALSAVAAFGTGQALAHGEADESVADFHEHLDDYRGEIEAFIAEVEPIVERYRADEDVQPMIDDLIERWEEIAVHGAIETHAVPTYAGIWQAMVSLQQVTQEGAPDAEVAAAADDVAASLWQAFGALRLAAAQVEAGEKPHAGMEHGGDDAHHDAGPEAIGRIVSDLDAAVAAYGEGDTKRAESMIEDAYMQRFEFLEGDLIEADPDLVRELEKHFNATVPLLMQRGAPVAEVRDAVATMKTRLERARELLVEAEQSRSEVF